MLTLTYQILITILMCIAGYLLGSVAFGALISKLLHKDIRHAGSGNIGATNVSRLLGFKFGALVMVLDALKAYIVVLLNAILIQVVSAEPFAQMFSVVVLIYLPGFFVILGHCYPLLYILALIKKDPNKQTKSGGKGVSSTFGLLLSISPFIAFIFGVVWLIVTFSTRYVCLGSIVSCFIASFLIFIPYINMLYWLTMFSDDLFEFSDIATYWVYQLILCLLLLLNSFLVLIRHTPNIIRLINHNENKIFTKHK